MPNALTFPLIRDEIDMQGNADRPKDIGAINNTLHAEMSCLNDGGDRVDHRVTRRAGGEQ